MSSPVFTVANQLTLLRMGLAPVLMILVLSRELRWALVVFVVAGVTDLLDGLIARLGHQRTTLGAMLDPIADKLLMLSCLISLTWGPSLPNPVPAWFTIISLSRDFIILVSAMVINLAYGQRVFYPSLLGKASTFLQVVAVGLAFLENATGATVPLLRELFVATAALAVASALHYLSRTSIRPPRPAASDDERTP
jgi:cardiolipin synthase